MGEFASPAAKETARGERSGGASRPRAPLAALPAALSTRETAARVDRRIAASDGLPGELKSGLEQLSGFALDDVRVHRNSARPGRLQAHAYAQGSDIHLAPGQERHLPHEAWHVVQQKQGRVRANGRLLEGSPINTDPALEHEADLMGIRAQRSWPLRVPSVPARLRSAPLSQAEAPLQAVWIYQADGTLVWEQDPYTLKQGESYPSASIPRVLVEKGTKEVRFDDTGTASTVKRKPPPDHPELQELREAQGAQLRAALTKDPTKIKAYTQELKELTSTLEKLAGKSVPKKHQEKIQKLIDSGKIEGGKFRAVIKAQDEFTQSEASAAFINGLIDASKLTGDYDDDIKKYAAIALQLMSSLRTPTQSVVAPIDYDKQVTGMQHPTSKDQPVLEGGASGHSFSDRNRVLEQINIFKQAIGDKNASPNQVFLLSNLSSVTATLGTMSAPTSASNLPRFNLKREDTQIKDRDQIKKQANALAQALKIPISTDVQDFDAPWIGHKTPASPLRNARSAPKIKKPTTVSPPTTVPQQGPSQQTPNTAPPQQNQGTSLPQQASTIPPPQHSPLAPQQTVTTTTPQFQPLFATPTFGFQTVSIEDQVRGIRLQENVRAIADRLYRMLSNPQNEADQTRARLQQILFVIDSNAAAADVTQPNAVSDLAGLLEMLAIIYRRQSALLRRNWVSQNDNMVATDPQGQRVPALEQLFAECGQMAAFNVLTMLADPQGVQPDLNLLGNFENNISEDQLRAMIGQVRTDVPVFGNIAQVSTIVDMIAQHDMVGLAERNVSLEEAISLQPVLDFMNGASDSVVLVLNTEGHKLAGQDTLHWIAVRVTRTQAGLGIEYLDSLVAFADYTATFAALRQLLGRVPPQPPIQQPQAQGSPDMDWSLGSESDALASPDDWIFSLLDSPQDEFDLLGLNTRGSFMASSPNPFAPNYSTPSPNAQPSRPIAQDRSFIRVRSEQQQDDNPAKRRKLP